MDTKHMGCEQSDIDIDVEYTKPELLVVSFIIQSVQQLMNMLFFKSNINWRW